jgi:hypothetical protein
MSQDTYAATHAAADWMRIAFVLRNTPPLASAANHIGRIVRGMDPGKPVYMEVSGTAIGPCVARILQARKIAPMSLSQAADANAAAVVLVERYENEARAIAEAADAYIRNNQRRTG